MAVDTPAASQFSHEILNANPYAFLDDAPLEERRARAVQMRRTLPESVLREVGRLDPAAIDQVREEAMPDVRDADDLHDLLQTLVVFPAPVALGGWELLDSQMEAGTDGAGSEPARRSRPRRWTAVLGRFRAHAGVSRALSRCRASSRAAEPWRKKLCVEHALDRALLGWLGHSGPVTAAELHDTLGVEQAEVERSLLRLEATGAILRGHFRAAAFASGVRTKCGGYGRRWAASGATGDCWRAFTG